MAVPASLQRPGWLAALLAVVIVAVGAALLVTRPWQADTPGAQRVDVIAGGGSSTATSGPARSLRLPPITAMTVAPDGTIWAAASDGVHDEIVRITASGSATESVVHPTTYLRSLAVAPDGSLWAVDENGNIYRLANGHFGAAYARSGTRPYPTDGMTVRTDGQQPEGVRQLAFDQAGRTDIVETHNGCGYVRRIATDGMIETLAGRACSTTTDSANGSPADASDARTIALPLVLSFALLGDDAMVLRTGVAAFTVDLRTFRTSSLTSVSPSSPTTPPISDRPGAGSADVDTLDLGGSADVQMCGVSSSTWYAANPPSRPTGRADPAREPVHFPSSYDWRADRAPSFELPVAPKKHYSVMQVVQGRARLISATGDVLACTPRSVYVVATAPNPDAGSVVQTGPGSVIVRFPVSR